MNILVDSGLKKKIQIENRKHRRGIYYLWLFEKISFALVIAYAILFPIYCIVTGKFVSTNMRTGELSYFLVASFTSCIVAMGLAAVLFIYVLKLMNEEYGIFYYSTALFFHATALEATGNVSEAKKEFKNITIKMRKATINDPSFYEGYLYRLLSHVKIKEYDKALRRCSLSN